MKHRLPLLLLAAMLLPSRALAKDEGPSKWAGGALVLGGGITTGQLDFQGSQFAGLEKDLRIAAKLQAAATGRIGIRYFFDRPFGIDANLDVGFAKLNLPLEVDPTQAVALKLFPWSFRGHMIYRLHFSEAPESLAIQAELGARVIGYQIQENEFAQYDADNKLSGTGQALLVSTTAAAPSIGLGIHAPVGPMVIDLAGHVFRPTFIREAPQSSGRPGGGMGWSARLGLQLELTKSLGLRLEGQHTSLHVIFEGKGDRGGTGRGVTQAESTDSYTSGVLEILIKL